MAPLDDVQRRQLQQLLEKRQGFKQGVAELTRAACDVQLGATCEQELAALFPLVARTHQLLKARHTNIDFWRAGAALFLTCQHLQFPADQLAKLRTFQADAQAFIREASGADVEEASAIQASGNSEGSAASTGLPLPQAEVLELLAGPAPPPEAHFDDAGPIIDEGSERWRRAQVSGTPHPADAGQGVDGVAEGQDPAAAARARARSLQQQRQDLQRQILEGIQAVFSGVEAVSRGTDAIGRELDSLLGVLGSRAEAAAAAAAAQQQQQPARPPASKRVLASLPVVEATEQQLQEWGAGCACAVCTCELAVGDQVQVLPCRHMFHPPCVAPWLAKDNTCPMCRKELPTDDPHYEARKEREAELEAERRGAANAVRGGEHMYI